MDYVTEGIISVGIDKELDMGKGLSSSMDYLFKGIFYLGDDHNHGGVKTIPKAIHFWALKPLNEVFLEDMREIILSIKRMSGIKKKISLGYVEFDEITMDVADLDKFISNSRSKIYLLEHTDDVLHVIRDNYEQYYRPQFFDVMYISFNTEGQRVKSWVHTPFLFREVAI